MATSASLEAQLKTLYASLPGPTRRVPRYMQVLQWIHYAEQYRSAAEHLSTRTVPLFDPWFQLVGHSLECCIKAYLVAVGIKVVNEHDLVRLADLARSSSLDIHDHDIAMLVHVNHVYSRDLRSGTRFKSRYPTEKMEHTGSSVPSQERLTSIVSHVCARASSENELRNAPHLATKPAAPK